MIHWSLLRTGQDNVVPHKKQLTTTPVQPGLKRQNDLNFDSVCSKHDNAFGNEQKKEKFGIPWGRGEKTPHDWGCLDNNFPNKAPKDPRPLDLAIRLNLHPSSAVPLLFMTDFAENLIKNLGLHATPRLSSPVKLTDKLGQLGETLRYARTSLSLASLSQALTGDLDSTFKSL